jgi:hypothetical protein
MVQWQGRSHVWKEDLRGNPLVGFFSFEGSWWQIHDKFAPAKPFETLNFSQRVY